MFISCNLIQLSSKLLPQGWIMCIGVREGCHRSLECIGSRSASWHFLVLAQFGFCLSPNHDPNIYAINIYFHTWVQITPLIAGVNLFIIIAAFFVSCYKLIFIMVMNVFQYYPYTILLKRNYYGSYVCIKCMCYGFVQSTCCLNIPYQHHMDIIFVTLIITIGMIIVKYDHGKIGS